VSCSLTGLTFLLLYRGIPREESICSNFLDGKVADVFVMLSELQPPDEESGIREFKASLDDIGHWAGIPVGQCKDVLDNMVSNQKIVINKDTIKVNNINELIRFVSSKRRSQENNERD
jgi:hypothetical protein